MLVDYDVPSRAPMGAVFLRIGQLISSSDAQATSSAPSTSAFLILGLPSDAPVLSPVTSRSKIASLDGMSMLRRGR